jgi:hypothetical protein
VKHEIDGWLDVAGIEKGPISRRVLANGRVGKDALSERAVWQLVREYAAHIGSESWCRMICGARRRSYADRRAASCLDEKSQIQALDRTQPGLPLKKGRCGTMTHDYKRNGTTTLFAALNVLDGKVIGECHGRHRHQEWLKFLRRLDAGFPPSAEVASGDGQLRHAQRTARASVAEDASSLCASLCADQFKLAEFGGALV